MGLSEEPVRIRSAADLFEVLSSGSLGARLAVLQDIQAQPERPLNLGSHAGEDFIDLLVRLIPKSEGVIRRALTACLMCYQDPRASHFMAEAFARGKDAVTVLHLARRLSMECGLEFFRPFLWDSRTAQAAAAAEMCNQQPGLSPRENLRVAVLLGAGSSLPALDDPVWLEELRGDRRAQARSLAEGRGADALLLWLFEPEFDRSNREWLVQLSQRHDPELTARKLQAVLARGEFSTSLLKAALSLGLSLPVAVLESDQPEWHGLAIRAGLADERLEEFLEPHRSPLEASAAALRSPTWRQLQLLGDSRWQVRAEALRGLASANPRPLEEVRAKIYSEELGERAAAAELLLQWQDDCWLEEFAAECGDGSVRA